MENADYMSWRIVASTEETGSSDTTGSSSLTILNFAHFFACIDGEEAEALANWTKKTMRENAKNEYLTIVMQEKEDDRLQSYRAFEKLKREE